MHLISCARVGGKRAEILTFNSFLCWWFILIQIHFAFFFFAIKTLWRCTRCICTICSNECVNRFLCVYCTIYTVVEQVMQTYVQAQWRDYFCLAGYWGGGWEFMMTLIGNETLDWLSHIGWCTKFHTENPLLLFQLMGCNWKDCRTTVFQIKGSWN